MKLINVRRGQFVYYDNILHKVYAVKPFFKQSVHLIRLHDFEQVMVTAKEITYYKPKDKDSFIVNGKRYTLNSNRRAIVGDYILVIKPNPDSLDSHHLNAIELVSSVEDTGVISNKSNGIKHNEYWVLDAGKTEGATVIDKQVAGEKLLEEDLGILETVHPDLAMPQIGDVYQKNDEEPFFQAMVLAIKGRTVYLGGDKTVQVEDIMDTDKWTYVINIREQ